MAVALAAVSLSALAAAEASASSSPSPLAAPEFTLRAPIPSSSAAFSLLPIQGDQRPSPEAGPEPTPAMKKKWGRAMLETGAFLSYSTIRYWRAYSDFIEDWQYELTWGDQIRRFFTTEALRFDSNCYSVNWTHALAGALYYQMGRSNYLTVLESLLLTTGGSLFYEYIGEWREVISINDMIFTSLAGLSLGETWYQLGKYFYHQKSLFPRILGLLNPFVELNQFLDRKKPASKTYIQPGWHRMEIWAGWGRHLTSGREAVGSAVAGFEMQLIHIPEYGRPGTFRRAFQDTTFTEIMLDTSLRKRLPLDPDVRDGLDEQISFYARAAGWTTYRQMIDQLSRGYAVSFSLGSAFSYVRRRPVVYDAQNARVKIDPPPTDPVDFRDKISVIHVIGPVLDWTRFGRGWKLRSVTDAYLDFAMAGSTAINEYSRIRGIDGLKTTLKYYGYHYAFGASASTRLDLEWRGFLVRGLVSGHIWDSVEGLDRFQADVTDDVNAVDTRVRYLLKISWSPPGAALGVFAGHEGLRRWGRISGIEGRSFDAKTSAGLSLFF